MKKHIISVLCTIAVLSLLGIAFADFHPADCIALSVVVLAVYSAYRYMRNRRKKGCFGCCSGCSQAGNCTDKGNHSKIEVATNGAETQLSRGAGKNTENL